MCGSYATDVLVPMRAIEKRHAMQVMLFTHKITSVMNFSTILVLTYFGAVVYGALFACAFCFSATLQGGEILFYLGTKCQLYFLTNNLMQMGEVRFESQL